MKKWTEKFLRRKPLEKIVSAFDNALAAQKSTIKFPLELWLELSTDAVCSRTIRGFARRKNKSAEIFMAGVAVGWAEKSESVK